MEPNNISSRLIRIADAARCQDGSDIPLGQELRAAAARIEKLEDLCAAYKGQVEYGAAEIERLKEALYAIANRVVGEAEAQVSFNTVIPDRGRPARYIHDGDRLTIYQGEDGKLWARATTEFNDGRFVQFSDEREV